MSSRRFASRLFTNTDRAGRVRRYYLRGAKARGVYPGLRGHRCFAAARRPEASTQIIGPRGTILYSWRGL
jgi:hypothetical protein